MSRLATASRRLHGRRARLLIAAALAVLVGVAALLGVLLPRGHATRTSSVRVRTTLILGAYSNVPDDSVASFRALQAMVPGLRVRRSFSARLPATVQQTSAAGDAAAGLVSFLSVKPNFHDVGSDNGRIASLARSLPAGSYLTAWHEPENDMTASEYVRMFRNFYQVAKRANPSIFVGNVYMTYQWQSGRAVDTPDDWWVGSDYTDFLGTDTYTAVEAADPGDAPLPLSRDKAQLRWDAWASAKSKPLVIAELGVGQGFSDTARAACLQADAEWLRSHGYRMLLVWNGARTPPHGESWDLWGGERNWPRSLQALQQIGQEADASSRIR